SARVTEGFVAAFEPRGNAMSQGVRILARFNGLPANARVFVPTAIAGSSALRPTAAGDFGGTLSAGEYVPGSRTLLLVRVQGADANGAGGFVQFSPTTSPAVLNELQELTTSNGTALATYEVLDSNPAALESAQLPAFLGLPLSQFPQSLNITRTLSFGPISTVGSVSAFAPVPRFIPAPPPADCDVLRDCNLYRGKLVVNSALLDWEVPQGLAYVRREVIFSNESNSRFMPWTARVEYKTGSGWVELAPSYGFEPVAIGVQAVLTNLQPGIHEATLIIDAGEAGVARIPIRVKLNPRPVDPSPVPTVTSTGSAATFSGSLVPGSLAIIRGTNLGGANLQVTFNGIAARTLYTSSDQLNVEVPAALTGTTAQLVVTAGGVASAPVTVNLAAVSPGIFVPGIRNQDSSVNGPQTPAPTGSYVSVYATGLLPAGATTGNVEVIMHGYTLQPSYAGPAPGVPGVQQVNLQIPLGWPTMLTDIALCNTAGGQRTCSPGVRISLLQAQ
ncbi:MAG TPA: IPT/TIG domain-containing protein, partial [Bryobacteraceae bacterium]|nr:IPT/TIG domain-containing protein [Bryobacteraceae bacterium]